MSSESFSFEDARKPVQQSTASGQPATFSFEEATGKPPKPRTLATVANDTVIEVANAAAGGVASIGNFIKPGNAASGWIDKNIIKAGEDAQSDVVKASKQKFRQEVESADGISGELGAVGRYVVQNPLLSAAQAAGSFAGPGLAVKGVTGVKALEKLGPKAVEYAGRATGALTGVAMSGGDAAGNAYELASKAGATEDQAVAAGRQASVIPGIIGGLSGLVGAEGLLAGGKGFAGGTISKALKTGAVEASGEAVEEGVTQYEGQRAAMPYDKSIDPTKGVAAAAGMGAALGGITGAGASILSGGVDQASETSPPAAGPTTSPGAADPNAPAPQPAAAPEAPNFDTSGLSLADPADTIAARLKPSELMGLNPAAGALSREVAAFVDATPFTEVTPIEQRAGIGGQRRLGERPIIDVEAREIVEPGATIAGRLSGPSPSSPIQAAAQQAVTNVAASPRLPYNQSQQGDTFANEATQAQQAAAQRAQARAAQAEPALIEASGQAWDSYSAEQRAAVARSAGVRGAMSRSVAAKGWGDLSPNLRASIAASIQPSGLPWGASNVGNASTPQPFTVSGREGSGNLLAQGQRGTRLSGNGDGVRGGSDGARSGVAGAGVGEAGLAPVAGRAGTAPALTQGVAPNATEAGQAQVAAPGQAAADPRFAGQAAAGTQAGGVSAPRPAGVEANGLTPESVAITSARIARREDSRSSDPRTDRILAQENYLRDLALNQPEEARRVAREMRGNSGAMSDAAGVSPDMIGRYASIIERSLPADTNAQPQNAEAGQQYVAQPQGAAQTTPARKKARQHPPTVRGSGALAEVSRALGGISPDLLADLSEKVNRTRTSKTGKATKYTSWDNPAIPGVGPLFRKGGTGDIAEVARVLEEAGYLEAGANERDPIGAAQRAQEIIRGELRKGGSATQVGNADAIDVEMRARLNAEMEAAMDAESDPWDDFTLTPEDLDEVGFSDASDTAKALTEQLMAEAEALGIDTETIREDVARQVGEEASQDEYHAATQEALRAAVSQAGRPAGQGDTGRARAGNQDGSGTAEQAGREGGQGQRQGGSDQVDDWRERAGQNARTSFESDVERSIAGSVPVVSNDIAREASSGWRAAVERRVGKWGLVDNQMDSVDRISLIKGNDLAHFYYRKGDAADRARATSAAEAWAKNDGKTPDSPREALTLEAQTEEDLRAKTEREEAAAKQAAADKAAEQERLRREAEARDNKARADATVDDFQLGQTAEQQMSGMDDLFGASSEAQQEPAAEVSAPTKPAPTESPNAAGLEAIFEGLQGRGLKKKAATEAAKAHPLAERITLVDKHILDILSDLDDSGTIKINC